MREQVRDYRVICDRSGFKVWRSQCKLEWTGLLVYAPFWELRNIQDFLKPRPEQQRLNQTRPPQTITEVDPSLPPPTDPLAC